MTTIIFTDTHFGVKQNSITWLNSQLDFINNQLIPHIKSIDDNVRLVHLGDVFDSRSSISTYIATKVYNIFKELSCMVNEFVIVAGNHDFYSPNSSEVDTISLMFKDLDITIVKEGHYIQDNDLFVPWYTWFDQQNLQTIIDKHNIKNVYTHADIIMSKVDIRGVDIYSGHTHIPYIKGHIRNLGSCYALNFGDSNAPRGFYELTMDGLKFIENTESIRFYRLYNDDVFKNWEFRVNDYIEIYVTQSNIAKPKYNHLINKLTSTYKNVWVIPQVTQTGNSCDVEFDGYDISSITESMIPDNLKDKFKLVLNNIT